MASHTTDNPHKIPVIHLIVSWLRNDSNEHADLWCMWCPKRHTNAQVAFAHRNRDKMDAILQTTFSNAFYWLKIFEFQIKSHWHMSGSNCQCVSIYASLGLMLNRTLYIDSAATFQNNVETWNLSLTYPPPPPPPPPPLPIHVCVSGASQQCFRQWLVAYSAPSHYLNQYWAIVNWTLRNKFQWDIYQLR